MEYPRLGALPEKDRTEFRLWAPSVDRVELQIEDGRPPVPVDGERGYFAATVEGVGAGTRYRYRVNGEQLFPDPAARFQPEGVHGASEVVDPSSYTWGDADWTGIPQEDLVFYELHIGTFTPQGTFDGVRRKLEYLRSLGITAIELMPVADFPGSRNWGYDPASLYAPSRAYGRPDALRRLVDEAHQAGMAVFLDVIYNHLGPDGAYVAAFAPMFTDRHQTPWGSAINLDDRQSEGVRAFFIDNALHWLREYHIDGLRLDATHALIDDSDQHFLAELSEVVDGLEGRQRYLFAEDPRNINQVVRPRSQDGYGMDGIWTDDFHHQIRNMTAGDREAYYADYGESTMKQVADTIRNGWYFDGRPSPTTGKPRGTSAAGVRHDQCVVCIQNHDQVGNRPLGNRLTDEIDLATYRAATALLLFSPQLPLLFMGQEWAASSPFLFFTDHNEELGKLVTEGRRDEFKSFSGFQGAEVPDPQEQETFEQSRVRWEELEQASHATTHKLYQDLLALRRQLRGSLSVRALSEEAIVVMRGDHHLITTFSPATALPLPDGAEIVFDTEQADYCTDRQPLEVKDGVVQFSRAGALVARVPR